MKHKLFLLLICMMTAICVNAQEVNDSTYNNQNPPPGYNELGLITEYEGEVGVFDPGLGQPRPHPAPPDGSSCIL